MTDPLGPQGPGRLATAWQAGRIAVWIQDSQRPQDVMPRLRRDGHPAIQLTFDNLGDTGLHPTDTRDQVRRAVT